MEVKTGEQMVGRPAGRRSRGPIRRGSFRARVLYWTDGNRDERVIYVTTGYRLVELNAKTGVPISSFGTGGAVDLKVGVVKGVDQQIDLQTGEIGLGFHAHRWSRTATARFST